VSLVAYFFETLLLHLN